MVRDTRTMVITLIMPLALLLLFGFAISTEVNHVRVVATADRIDDEVRDILQRLEVNGYFDFKGMASPEDVENILRHGDADAALNFMTDHGSLRTQIVVDASNTTIAQASANYLRNLIAPDRGKPAIIIRTLYNPGLKSSFNFVPGILGMIFILVCAIMTSVSIVSEKENGTMNLLLVSPVKPPMIIFGKLIPYFLLSCIILTLMLLISFTLLGIPYSANLPGVVLLSVVYIILSLSIGLFVSTIVSTQLTALMVSAVGFMLPVVMLSGMIFPIENMPAPLQWLSCAIPARWYIAAMRKLMIQQLDFIAVGEEMLILCGIMIALIAASVKKFNTRH